MTKIRRRQLLATIAVAVIRVVAIVTVLTIHLKRNPVRAGDFRGSTALGTDSNIINAITRVVNVKKYMTDGLGIDRTGSESRQRPTILNPRRSLRTRMMQTLMTVSESGFGSNYDNINTSSTIERPQNKNSSDTVDTTTKYTAVTADYTAVTANYTAVTANYTAVTANYTAVTTNYTAVTANYTAVTANYTPVTTNYTPVTTNYTPPITLSTNSDGISQRPLHSAWMGLGLLSVVLVTSCWLIRSLWVTHRTYMNELLQHQRAEQVYDSNSVVLAGGGDNISAAFAQRRRLDGPNGDYDYDYDSNHNHRGGDMKNIVLTESDFDKLPTIRFNNISKQKTPKEVDIWAKSSSRKNKRNRMRRRLHGTSTVTTEATEASTLTTTTRSRKSSTLSSTWVSLGGDHQIYSQDNRRNDDVEPSNERLSNIVGTDGTFISDSDDDSYQSNSDEDNASILDSDDDHKYEDDDLDDINVSHIEGKDNGSATVAQHQQSSTDHFAATSTTAISATSEQNNNTSDPLSSSTMCSICIEEFVSNEPVVMLPSCCHLYHKECIRLWLLDQRSNCPMCKKDVIVITESSSTSENTNNTSIVSDNAATN